MFQTGALTYRDLKEMPADEYYEALEALNIWNREWKPPEPRCPLVK